MFGLVALTTMHAFSNDAARVPAALMEVWERHWNRSTRDLVNDVIERYTRTMPNVDAKKRTAMLDEMRTILRAEISWEALGYAEVEKLLLRYCGEDLLEAAAPYYEGSFEFDAMPKESLKSLRNCDSDVDVHMTSIPGYKMMAVAKESFTGLFIKHGIDPRSLK